MPGVPNYFLGVYDHPADPDIPGVRSRFIGDSAAARYTVKAQSAVDRLLDELDAAVPW